MRETGYPSYTISPFETVQTTFASEICLGSDVEDVAIDHDEVCLLACFDCAHDVVHEVLVRHVLRVHLEHLVGGQSLLLPPVVVFVLSTGKGLLRVMPTSISSRGS